jgi:hypothetical protein
VEKDVYAAEVEKMAAEEKAGGKSFFAQEREERNQHY